MRQIKNEAKRWRGMCMADNGLGWVYLMSIGFCLAGLGACSQPPPPPQSADSAKRQIHASRPSAMDSSQEGKPALPEKPRAHDEDEQKHVNDEQKHDNDEQMHDHDEQMHDDETGPSDKTAHEDTEPEGMSDPDTSPPFTTLAELIASPAELVASEYQFVEGPLWHPDGYLIFSDIPARKILKWSQGSGKGVFRAESQGSNGLTFDREGRLVACEHGSRSVTRTEANGKKVAIAERFEGKRFNSPNDCIVDRQGVVYFTDPPYGLENRPAEVGFNGVFRVTPDGKITVVAKNFDRPNGLALSPQENLLYIADTARNHIKTYRIAGDQLHDEGVFINVDHPDGIKVDRLGYLYVTSSKGLVVFRPDGQRLGVVPLPEQPANCAFGDADFKSLYVTARTGLYRIRLTLASPPN